MNKILLLLLISVFSLSNVFAQEDGDFGDFVPGSEEIFSEYFGDVCSTIPTEIERIMCSNDQIKDYISTLKTPALVEEKKIKASVIVYFDLNTSGVAENITIKKSSGNQDLDNIVLEHFKKMPNWHPMTIDGIPYASENMTITYKFKPTPKK